MHCVKEHNLIWIAINNAPQNPSEVCRFGQSLNFIWSGYNNTQEKWDLIVWYNTESIPEYR